MYDSIMKTNYSELQWKLTLGCSQDDIKVFQILLSYVISAIIEENIPIV